MIFVRDGAASTSAGVTTGIDLATAMVEEDLGSAAGDSAGTAGGVAPRVASIWHYARP